MASASKKKEEWDGGKISIEDVPEAVLVADSDYRVSDANAIALLLLGYEKKDIIGQHIVELMPEIDRHLHRVLQGDLVVSELSVRAKRKDGSKITMDFLAMPMEEDGSTKALLFFGRDTRFQHLMSGELRKARDWFKSIVEYSPNGICITDVAGNIILANQATENLTGYQLRELIGNNVNMYYPEEDGRNVDLRKLHKGEQIIREVEFRRKGSGSKPVMVTYRMIDYISDVGEVIIETYADQSDRKRLDQLRNEFVFIAAHEFRNPVTALRLLLDMFKTDKRIKHDPIEKGYLSRMEEATQRLIHLVDDLLEVSRSEAGRLRIEVKPCDVREHVKSIVKELQSEALLKEVMIVYKPDGRLPQILADSSKLKEVLSNLISNAVKYNIAGGSVMIEHDVDRNTQVLTTHIIDTGIGMNTEDLEKVFTKFWRSEDLAVRAQAGTGLGLFIVKELIERMGGEVSVESEKGKGSNFSFSLPIPED
ncbi:MAG: PAS domain-containing sensor histidine kinase [Patescibacteria group bacterium]|nr:PAS domain-containing sensor histidine kinase [Patescibacteria group bacterium]